MKLQCELCKEIVPADFSIAGDAIEVACPACKGTFRAPARAETPVVELARARAARQRPADGEPAMTCPKCGDVQSPAPACRSCGLLADRMAAFVDQRDARVPAEVTAAWAALGTAPGAWADEAAHDRFIRAVSTAQAFPYAAQRYREALRLDPGDEMAAAQLARVARMAEATLLVSSGRSREKPSPHPYRKVLIMLGAFVAIAIFGIVFSLMLARNADDAKAKVREIRERAEQRSGATPTPVKPPKPPKRRDAGPTRP